jgi:hypothetical protein
MQRGRRTGREMLLDRDLCRAARNDLGGATIFLYRPGHADVLSGIVSLQVAEFASVAAPDQKLRLFERQGRHELFDRMADRQRATTETDGWAGCVLTCAEAEV